jgi:hypothetical protein
MNDLISQISPQHLILAYAGMILHILMKLSELSKTPDFTVGSYIKKNIFTMIATFIMIPVLLIMAKDEAIKDTLPINNVTAVLAGWQTNSLFKTVMGLFGKKGKVDSPDVDAGNNNEPKPDDIG